MLGRDGYLAKAAELHRRAAEAVPADRRSFHQMADNWRELAALAERLAKKDEQWLAGPLSRDPEAKR
jgi:hypothetical protein